MAIQWIRENPAFWDANKAKIVGGAPAGAFEIGPFNDGDVVPGEWYRAERDGRTVGYGWMDVVWGDGEVLLAVDPSVEHSGVGAFILGRLAAEASARGLRRIYNVVRPTHPQRDAVTSWLQRRGFHEDQDGTLHRRVRASSLD